MAEFQLDEPSLARVAKVYAAFVRPLPAPDLYSDAGRDPRQA